MGSIDKLDVRTGQSPFKDGFVDRNRIIKSPGFVVPIVCNHCRVHCCAQV